MTALRARGLGLLLVLVATVWLIGVALRRLVRGPRLPGWTVRQETMVRLLRYFGGRMFDGSPGKLLRGRERVEALASLARLPEARYALRRRELAGRPAQELAPRDTPAGAPLIYFFHGGGYTFCSPQTHTTLVARLCRAAGARALSLDYRLAPEHPFPAALDDALAGYRRLLAEGQQPDRLVLCGDSAGGGLALALLQALRDEGLPLPAGAALLSPWVDLAADDPSLQKNAPTDYLGSPGSLRRTARLYLGQTPADHPLASPLHGELAGLPPLLLHAGGAEMIRDQVVRLARRAEDAGVDVELSVFPEMIHVFHSFADLFPTGREGIAGVGAFVQRITAQP